MGSCVSSEDECEPQISEGESQIRECEPQIREGQISEGEHKPQISEHEPQISERDPHYYFDASANRRLIVSVEDEAEMWNYYIESFGNFYIFETKDGCIWAISIHFAKGQISPLLSSFMKTYRNMANCDFVSKICNDPMKLHYFMGDVYLVATRLNDPLATVCYIDALPTTQIRKICTYLRLPNSSDCGHGIHMSSNKLVTKIKKLSPNETNTLFFTRFDKKIYSDEPKLPRFYTILHIYTFDAAIKYFRCRCNNPYDKIALGYSLTTARDDDFITPDIKFGQDGNYRFAREAYDGGFYYINFTRLAISELLVKAMSVENLTISQYTKLIGKVNASYNFCISILNVSEYRKFYSPLPIKLFYNILWKLKNQ